MLGCDWIKIWTGLTTARAGSRILQLYFYSKRWRHSVMQRQWMKPTSELDGSKVAPLVPSLAQWRSGQQLWTSSDSSRPQMFLAPSSPVSFLILFPSIPPRWHRKETELHSDWAALFCQLLFSSPVFSNVKKDITFMQIVLTGGRFLKTPPTFFLLPHPW